MDYYLDTEFNGFGGNLISLGIVREDGECLYLINENYKKLVFIDWVEDNVIPILKAVPIGVIPEILSTTQFSYVLESFLKGDDDIAIHVDWPDDIRYLMSLVITGPGTMINIPGFKTQVHRVDSYPTDLKPCYQHNAIWDAIALRYKLTGKKEIKTCLTE